MRGTPASSLALAAAAPSAVSENRMSPISALNARFESRSGGEGGAPGRCWSPDCPQPLLASSCERPWTMVALDMVRLYRRENQHLLIMDEGGISAQHFRSSVWLG